MEKIKIKLNRLEAEWLLSMLMSVNEVGYNFQVASHTKKGYMLLLEITTEDILTKYLYRVVNSNNKSIAFILSIPEANTISGFIVASISNGELEHAIAWASSITVKIDAELNRIITARHRIAQARKERF